MMECYGQGKLKYRRKTCTNATLSTKNPIRTGLVSNLGLRSKMQVTNWRTCWYPHTALQNIMSHNTTTVPGANECSTTQQNWTIPTTLHLLYSLVIPMVLLILLNSPYVWKVHCLLSCWWCAHLSQYIITSPGKLREIWVLHTITVPEWCYLHRD